MSRAEIIADGGRGPDHGAASPRVFPLGDGVGVPLAPASDVAWAQDGGWVATSAEPWLRIAPGAPAPAGEWIELSFAASLVERLARPVLRFLGPDGYEETVLPAPVCGRAHWFGKVPRDAHALWISPADRAGPFHFRVLGLRRMGFAERVLLAARRNPARAAASLGLAAAGLHRRADRQMRRALLECPLADFSRWREARSRPADWGGFDALPATAADGPHIRVLMTGADPAAAAQALGRLRSQPWPNWSLAAPAAALAPQAGVLTLDPAAPLCDALADLRPQDLFTVCGAGGQWAPQTLAVMGSAAMRDLGDVYYADEETLEGGPPRLKPGWGPVLAQGIDVPGAAWFARVGFARGRLVTLNAREAAERALPAGPPLVAVHVPRFLLKSASRPTPAKPPTAAPALGAGRLASLIIPTRDGVDLLRVCCESLGRVPVGMDFEVIVVDNGSEREETAAYLAALRRDPRFRVLARPGPFNFSALCNAGAAEARGDALVFLNNDTEALSADWLACMVRWTRHEGVGAVGAKLLYPDRNVQHAGVALGVRGHTGHFERLSPMDSPGIFGRLLAPHELSAVTGACLAVDKAKFDAVGGFDAVKLPVELSDVDLCLRLGGRGWTALLEPAAVLVHHETATRERSVRHPARYAAEIAFFKAKWRQVLRADPYFHPALSLESSKPALA